MLKAIICILNRITFYVINELQFSAIWIFKDKLRCVIAELPDALTICCIIKVPKVAEPKWRTLHLQFGECCSEIA